MLPAGGERLAALAPAEVLDRTALPCDSRSRSWRQLEKRARGFFDRAQATAGRSDGERADRSGGLLMCWAISCAAFLPAKGGTPETMVWYTIARLY